MGKGEPSPSAGTARVGEKRRRPLKWNRRGPSKRMPILGSEVGEAGAEPELLLTREDSKWLQEERTASRRSGSKKPPC